MTIALNKISALILDYMLNVDLVIGYNEMVSSVREVTSATNEDIKQEWDSLVAGGIIVEKDYRLEINSSYLEDIKKNISELLSNDNISPNMFTRVESEISEKPERRKDYIALLSKVDSTGEQKRIIFSDYEWLNTPGALCESLTKMRIVFLLESNSKKHSYKYYYLRKWPFDVYEMLRKTILTSLNIEHLSDTEWRLIFQLLFGKDSSLPYDSLKSNLDMTEAELRECITNLKEKGHLVEQYNTVTLVKGVYPSVLQYFGETIYPRFTNEIVSRVKRKVIEGFSNFYPFMYAKRLNEMRLGESRYDVVNIKIIKKNEVPQPEQLYDVTRLGLALDLGDSIVLLVDVIKEIENWIKGSLNSSLILIPADSPFLADLTLKKIFTSCDTYLKIQDPYIGEDTFRLLANYVPKDIEIRVLTGQEIGHGETFEEISEEIERFKNERKGKFQIQFIAGKGKEAPFHDRFIISKDKCWQIGTSLKQIGKGKDTTIFEISPNDKNEKIELAFNWNWSSKKRN